MELVIAVLTAVIMAMLYSIVGYIDAKAEINAEFDYLKLMATAIIGAIVGAVLYSQGVVVTSESVAPVLLAYTGLTAFVYKIIKAIAAKFDLLPECWIV